jgi:hypothetical protein
MTTVAVEKQYVLHILSVCVTLAIQHAMRMFVVYEYWHLWSVWLYHIFFTLSHKGHDFRENIEYKMCVLIFFTTFAWNISYSQENSARYYYKCTQIFMWSSRYSWQIWIKLEFPWIFSEKSSNIKFYKDAPNGGRVVFACGQTDMRKLIVAFRNFVKAPKKRDTKRIASKEVMTNSSR